MRNNTLHRIVFPTAEALSLRDLFLCLAAFGAKTIDTMKVLFNYFSNSAAFQRFILVLDIVNAQIADAGSKIPTFGSGVSRKSENKRWIRESNPKFFPKGSIKKGVKAIPMNSKGGEFKKFATIVSWIISNKSLRPYFYDFLRRVERLIVNNSNNYAFAYLKECLRLSVRALSGNPELNPQYSGVIRVRRDSFGIPTILPLSMRLVLHSYILASNPQLEEKEHGFTTHPSFGPSDYVNKPKFNQKDIVGVLTLLSVFRVFKTTVRASVKTIVKPFDGFLRTLPSGLIHDALKRMCTPIKIRKVFDTNTWTEIVTVTFEEYNKPNIRYGKFTPHKSLKSGPNGSISTWSAGLDALAFLHEPSKAVALIRWMNRQEAYGYILWFIVILILFGPLYYFMYVITNQAISPIYKLIGLVAGNERIYYSVPIQFVIRILQFWRVSVGHFRGERFRLYLGKLSVVFDQAGKARVVASANWWMQSALRGLHDSIFSFLKRIPNDGTHNQEAAFNQFITKVNKTVNMSGFDLSAATDRLPIDLQVDVLNSLGIDGLVWKELMDVTYIAKFEHDGNTDEIKYSVGQPMGAYSSWAMLALTHHVIVNIAAITTGHGEKDINYAVLGDDMVINNHDVAAQYLNIMSALGLEISMGKSVISTRFTEFAKKLRGPGVDFSPIGAGAVLSAVRSGYMFPALFLSALGNVITSPDEILELTKKVPSGLVARHDLERITSLVLWQLFGPSSPLNRYAASFGRVQSTLLEHVSGIPKGATVFEHVKDSMSNLFVKRIRTQIALSHFPMVHFLTGSMTILVSGSPFLRVLETLMKPFNPGFWIFLSAAFTLRLDLDKRMDEVYSSFPGYSGLAGESFYRTGQIMTILAKASPELSILELNFSKAENKLRATYFKELLQDMSKRHALSEAYPLNTRWYELEMPTSHSSTRRSSDESWLD